MGSLGVRKTEVTRLTLVEPGPMFFGPELNAGDQSSHRFAALLASIGWRIVHYEVEIEERGSGGFCERYNPMLPTISTYYVVGSQLVVD